MPPKRKSMFTGEVEAGKCDNLAELENLNEETLLEELRVRYSRDVMYTYVGEILVAMNPYKTIPNLYGAENTRLYRNGVDKKTIPPHIFAVADNAFQAVSTTCKDQVCVISGESGAGKTESAKLFLKHVVEISKGSESPGLEDKIIKVNPLLEAFGNAQTVMNDNSSRFGKYLDLRLNKDMTVRGATITEYLLEKSRVVHQAEGEQNFHIFYYFFAGLDAASKTRYQLLDPSQHRYVNGNSEALRRIKTPQFLANWKEVYEILNIVGFTQQERENLFSIIAGVIHLGDVTFSGDDSSDVSNLPVLSRACNQLSIAEDNMVLGLTTLVTITRGEEIIRNYKPDQAGDCRDATAKALYNMVFSWIVKRTNTLTGPKTKDPADLKISFLDIFGFENFDVNSLEQLCINLANEQLQFYFNDHIFAMELAEYAKEGIDGSKITYENNQPVLDMILQKKPPGLITILDEQCAFPKASDQTMVEAFHAAYTSHKDYKRPTGNDCNFSVKHYAGLVKYDGYGFLEKNRDTLAADVMAVFRMSENLLVRELFGGDEEDAKEGKTAKKAGVKDRGASRSRLRQSMKKVNQAMSKTKKQSVSSGFRESLEALMVNLNAAEPHFIRCIKPNLRKAPADYNNELVTKQLRYTGMLETTRIRREGYPVRPTFDDFMFRYKVLGYYLCANVPPSPASCRKVLEKSGTTGWLIGKTKVFMKYFHVDQLNDKLRPINGKAIIIQKWVRRFLARRKLRKLKEQARNYAKLLSAFITYLERNGSSFRESILALNEEDKKRGIDYWAKSSAAPPPIDRSMKKKEPESLSSAQSAKFKRAASVKWFKEVEMKKGAALGDSHTKTSASGFATWFHGILTRDQSEALLNPLKQGSFLVRVSESRFGYSLSFKHNNRIKHFMIDQTPDGRYMVVGNDRTFPGLNELVYFHSTHALTEDGDLLLHPCPAKAESLAEFI